MVVVSMDDNAIISLFAIAFSITSLVIAFVVNLERRINAVYKDLSCKLMEQSNKLGEISGKLEMLIKYMNDNRR